MTETNAKKWSLEKIKRYDDSWWLRYLEVYSVFDTGGIKAQKDWLIEQAERVQELEIDLNICKMSKRTIGDINGFTDEIRAENKRLLELNQSYEKAMNGLVKAIEIYSGKTAKKAMEDLVELVEAID